MVPFSLYLYSTFLPFLTFLPLRLSVYPFGCPSILPPFFPPPKSGKFSNTGERIQGEVKALASTVSKVS